MTNPCERLFYQMGMDGIPDPHPVKEPSAVDMTSEKFRANFAQYARMVGMIAWDEQSPGTEPEEPTAASSTSSNHYVSRGDFPKMWM